MKADSQPYSINDVNISCFLERLPKLPLVLFSREAGVKIHTGESILFIYR